MVAEIDVHVLVYVQLCMIGRCFRSHLQQLLAQCKEKNTPQIPVIKNRGIFTTFKLWCRVLSVLVEKDITSCAIYRHSKVAQRRLR
jgi:hypothetical protein